MKLDRPLIVVDTETTGLHPARNQVLSLGMVFVNRELAKVGRMEWFVNMENPLEILRGEYRRAQKVHQIGTWKALFGGQSLEDVVYELEGIASSHPGALIAGNNVGFDYAFMTRMFEMAGKKNPFDYHCVDLTGLAAVHLGIVSLAKIMGALGIDQSKYTKHSAIGDAEATADALIALLKIIRTDDEYVAKYIEGVGKRAGEIVASRLVRKSGPGMYQGDVERNSIQ